jgi:2-polyprenyl-3-methyl-5-hydroxy-6-metoxy-1,4-benzoquinol methylase
MSMSASALHDKPYYYLGGGVPAPLVRYYFSRVGNSSQTGPRTGKPRRVLDLGCGIGDVGRYAPSSGVRVYGADIDLRALAVASASERVTAWNAERGGLPFRDGTFDVVIAKDILEHVQQPWDLVAEIGRVLAPGGQAIISVPMAKPHIVWDDYTHVRGFTRHAITALLRDGGFKVVRIWRMGPVPLSSRLQLMHLVPNVLAIPIFDWLWGSSWELLVRRAPADRRGQ